MDKDCTRARAKFIDRSVDIREQLSFAHPDQIIKAMEVYCCDGYGSMLWSLDSETAESYFKSWNTAVKLIYQVPRMTYTYLVEGLLARRHTSLRNQVLGRYPRFLQGLLKSPSKEVRLLANIVAREPHSNTRKNIRYIEQLTQRNPCNFSTAVIKKSLPVKLVPEDQKWRVGLITNLIKLRSQSHLCAEDHTRVSAMIDSLCST